MNYIAKMQLEKNKLNANSFLLKPTKKAAECAYVNPVRIRIANSTRYGTMLLFFFYEAHLNNICVLWKNIRKHVSDELNQFSRFSHFPNTFLLSKKRE